MESENLVIFKFIINFTYIIKIQKKKKLTFFKIILKLHLLLTPFTDHITYHLVLNFRHTESSYQLNKLFSLYKIINIQQLTNSIRTT